MNAYTASRSFAASANTVVARDSRSSFAAAPADPIPELHNSRGLVIAILMSAACWAGVGLAFLL
jgi:hypothetical protein